MVARAVGALEATGVVSSATSNTVVSADLIHNQDDALIGFQYVPKSGTSFVTGNERIISDFVASSDTASVARNWGTNPVNGDTYDIYNPAIADKALLDDAIKIAIERVQDIHLPEWEDEISLAVESILRNAGFEDWTAGITTAPDSWTLSGTNATVSRESTIKKRGRYSCKIVTSGFTGVLTQGCGLWTLPLAELAGKTLTARMWVYTTSASAATLAVDNGAGSPNAVANAAAGWELLEVSETLTANPSANLSKVYLTVTAGETVYLAEASLIPSGIDVIAYPLPKKFTRVSRILHDADEDFEFNTTIPQRYWYADPSRELLVFNEAMYTPPSGSRLKLIGNMYQIVPTSDASEIVLSADYIVAQARAYIWQLRDPQNAAQAAMDALRVRRQLHRQPRSSSKVVR